MWRALLWRLIAASEAHLSEGQDPPFLAAHTAALKSHIATQVGEPPAELVAALLTAAAGPLSPGIKKALADVHAHAAAVPALAASIPSPATAAPETPTEPAIAEAAPATTTEAPPAETPAPASTIGSTPAATSPPAPAQAAPPATAPPSGFAPTT